MFARDKAHGSARGDIRHNAEQYLHENITLDDDTDFFQMLSDEFCMPMQEPVPAPSPIRSETQAPQEHAERGKVLLIHLWEKNLKLFTISWS